MKALIWEKYGPPETLRMGDVEKPVPGADEVLVTWQYPSMRRTGIPCAASPFFARHPGLAAAET